MTVNENEMKMLINKYGFKYINYITDLPKGGIRIYSKFLDGSTHSVILTRDQFVNEYGLRSYMTRVTTWEN